HHRRDSKPISAEFPIFYLSFNSLHRLDQCLICAHCSTFQRIFLVLVLRRSAGTGLVAPAVPTGQTLPLGCYRRSVAPMGTIAPRKRQDGTIGYTAKIRLKRAGKIIHTEAQTFDRKPAAAAWLKKREGELAQPGALDRLAADDPPLADVIDQYIRESQKALGRTKEQVLRAIK